MKQLKHFLSAALMTAMAFSLTVSAQAADYTFETTAPLDYYGDTAYEDVYGAQYNYGGPNAVDYQNTVLPYGNPSTTQTGVMEKALLPGLQASVATPDGNYGVWDGPAYFPPAPDKPGYPTYTQPAYTSAAGMERSDGSIGTVKIPSLGISMKLWEGETSASMAKGLGHYATTSAWDGNVGVCGHNRGAKYVIGSIKNLKIGDTITYTTVYGTRSYAVSYVGTISSTDWSYLQATTDNRITLTTCLTNRPESRVCVQAVEK